MDLEARDVLPAKAAGLGNLSVGGLYCDQQDRAAITSTWAARQRSCAMGYTSFLADWCGLAGSWTRAWLRTRWPPGRCLIV